jgi:hypothetical protein
MSDIKVIENFVTKKDQKAAIDIIDRLVAEQGQLPDSHDGRSVFFKPSDQDAVDFIKKYSDKVIKNYTYASDVVVHDVIFVQSVRGARLDVHMDFDSIEACSECPYASVIYLNDDYKGSEIFFPKLNEQYSPKAGTAILFPQDDSQYAHGVHELTSGKRYIVNICYTKDVARQFDIYK